MITKYTAPLPWSVDRRSAGRNWTNSCSILDANGGEVCILTRGYQFEPAGDDGDWEGGPSWDNAELIVAAVNAYTAQKPANEKAPDTVSDAGASLGGQRDRVKPAK